MKAITPVIALVMLMLITVGLVGIAYLWFSGILSASTGKSISIQPGAVYCENNVIKVYLLNTGDRNITINDIIIASIDGTNTLNNGLLVNWKLDETSGSSATDSSGNGNQGMLGPSCPDCPVRTTGKTGGALQFVDDAQDNDYVIRNPVASFPTNEITAAFWMKSSDSTKAGTPLSYASPATHNDFLIYDYRSFSLFVKSNQATTGISANDGNWHHISVTWKSIGGETKLYKDGSLAWSGTLSPGLSITGGGSLVVGQEQDSVGDSFELGQAFVGLIDDVRIYNRVLSQPEIKFLFGVKPAEAGLVINYQSVPGKHDVKIGTSSVVVESSVTCK